MFRIRRIYDDATEIDRNEILQVQEILRLRIEGVDPVDVAELPQRLLHPLKYRFRSLLFVADDHRGRVHGFAMVFHDEELGFLYLDYLASASGTVGSGVGGALYERVREEAVALRCAGVFFECLPDDRAACSSERKRAANAARLRFYERYGARPIVGTAYELPLTEGGLDMPHLVFDGLDRPVGLPRTLARKIVRVILDRRYGDVCPPEYIEAVVKSFREDPVQLRAPRYNHKAQAAPARSVRTPAVALFVNAAHEIHHVRDRGYVEAPVRIRAIMRDLEPTGLFHEVKAKHYAERHILAVHDRNYVEYFKRVCRAIPEGRSVYPYVFPVRNHTRPPRDLSVRAGYYCIDTFTPLDRNALLAATGAVDCALSGADALLRGERIAYALVRPPGHHAERQVFGGFCYFNNGAIAAEYLRAHGRVAILDVDYHHGNGQQDIFWTRSDVLTVSIHAHPQFAYPYFSGFAEERGDGEGEGFNLNLPLAETIDGPAYCRALDKAIARVGEHDPAFLVVSLGLDTAKGDPTGTWRLAASDFYENGRRIGALRRPTLVVQEGGYRTRTLGTNARAFFGGLVDGARGIPPQPNPRNQKTKR